MTEEGASDLALFYFFEKLCHDGRAWAESCQSRDLCQDLLT